MEASFGIFENQARFSPAGTASPGRITISRGENSPCQLTVSVRGVVTNLCLPQEKR